MSVRGRKYLKLFDTHAEYQTYISGQDAILPNVSYCEDNNDVHYNPWIYFNAKFNVTSTSSPTTLTYSAISAALFSEMWIDGVKQDNILTEYTFDTTGEHTVKYVLVDPTTIGNLAFGSCSNLTDITIPKGITSIGNSAFYNCSSLTSLTIPNSVTSIGNNAFQNCTNLTDITIPNSVTSIGSTAFQNCTSLTSVGGVGSGASVEWPSGITSIRQDMFKGCIGLTSVTIGDSVTSIGAGAFSDCTGITSLTIPSSVTSITNQAFYNCSNLVTITSLATTEPTIEGETFRNIKKNGTLYVPTGSNYQIWMSTGTFYLGYYTWTKVEQ